jgi:hypothetical protein
MQSTVTMAGLGNIVRISLCIDMCLKKNEIRKVLTSEEGQKLEGVTATCNCFTAINLFPLSPRAWAGGWTKGERRKGGGGGGGGMEGGRERRSGEGRGGKGLYLQTKEMGRSNGMR